MKIEDLNEKQKEVYDLISPFFNDINISRLDDVRMVIDINDMVKYDKDPIRIYVSSNNIYSFGERRHSYLSPEYSNLFKFYSDFIAYMKLIQGMGTQRNWKY